MIVMWLLVMTMDDALFINTPSHEANVHRSSNTSVSFPSAAGRTARAGRAGRALTYVTQYDIELYQRIEALIGQKLPAFPAVEEAAVLLMPRVSEAQRMAAMEMREAGEEESKAGLGGKRKHGEGGDGDGETDDALAAQMVEDSQRKRRMIGQGIRKKGRGGGGAGGRRR